jgi:hypothetical protein
MVRRTHVIPLLVINALDVDGDTQFKCVECEGDVPMPRSDHAVVGYDGRFLLLFGGKNYEAEECYSDLYILDLASFEWWYVGEAGEELQVRCGHSLALLRAGDARHLVVFGGSSPEIGTCSADTYFAVLPPASEIGGTIAAVRTVPSLCNLY